jgi:hypothetical protein
MLQVPTLVSDTQEYLPVSAYGEIFNCKEMPILCS